MWKYLIAMTLVPALLIGWLMIQQLGRRYARAHPDLGSYREEGGGCGKNCGCHGGSCEKRGEGCRSSSLNRQSSTLRTGQNNCENE